MLPKIDHRQRIDNMNEVNFVDTTFRDGHASLWAEGMRTGMMLPVAPQMERVGFTSIELIATSHFKKCVRELREDPWERIRLVSKRITKIPLALMMHYGITTFDITPLSILKLWMELRGWANPELKGVLCHTQPRLPSQRCLFHAPRDLYWTLYRDGLKGNKLKEARLDVREENYRVGRSKEGSRRHD